VHSDVSIVIPTFNRSGLLPRAIDCALAQTVPVEVVVCDHGSSDATPEVARRYGKRIRYIRRDVDRGPIHSWRDGIEQATGQLVHINYDDDWIDTEFVARTQPLFDTSVGFVYTRALVHDPNSATPKPILRHPGGRRPMADIVQHLLDTELTISPGCALFRRSDLLKNLLPEVPGASGAYGRNSGVGEDLLLFLLTALDYPCYVHVPESLSHFLAHSTSITTKAGSSGRMDALISAYAIAKRHYLAQPGSIKPKRALGRRIDRLRWKLAARGWR
jgi:glycosyltransferase involved in cell wall biosynthesis